MADGHQQQTVRRRFAEAVLGWAGGVALWQGLAAVGASFWERLTLSAAVLLLLAVVASAVESRVRLRDRR